MTTQNKHRTSRVLGIGAILAAATLLVVTWPNQGHAATPERDGFADLVEQVEPSVVTIEVSKDATVQPMQFNGDPRAEEFFRRFFGERRMGPAEPQPVRGAGSGFVIDTDGYIVTNNHVVEGAENVTVRLLDGSQYTATIVGTDKLTDLALLKIEANDLPAASFGDSDDTRVGEWVVAIGNPFGLGGTATAGIVSARGRDIRSGPYDNYLQIDAPINRGNSGGPVFNMDGEVVGVNTAIFSPNGGSVGIGFAIPANQVDEIVSELKAGGVVDRGWLGVSLQDIDEELSGSLGLESQDGALVAEVVKDSPAQKGGVRVGDVIVKFNDESVSTSKDLARLVGSADSGQKARLDVLRDNDEVRLTVVLGAPENAAATSQPEQDLEELGIQVAPLTDALRAELRVGEDVEGAVITRVAPGSKAAAEGIRRGDILVEVDRTPVSSADDLKDIVSRAKKNGRESVPALVKRGNGQRFAVLPLA